MESQLLKLTDAVYKLIDFFPDKEPLKNKAKEKALAIMENLTKEKASSQLILDIEVLLSYLQIAKSNGWIDNVNFLIISEGYQNLKKEISPVRNHARVSAPEGPLGRAVSNGVEPTLTDRQKTIIKLLQEKEKAQVADIIKILPDITKRTIRRDLDDLLKKGKVVRTGEWNQVFYTLLDRTK